MFHVIFYVTFRLFLIDVTNVHHDGKFLLKKINNQTFNTCLVPAIHCNSPLHSVYEEAVKNRLKSMESRVSRVESFVPHLERRRQSLLERTTHILESRVAFLDRRIDELTPVQWYDYMENETIREKFPVPASQ